MMRDGVEIPVPTPSEEPAFNAWLSVNGDREPFHPDQHYDYVGTFRAGLSRGSSKPGEKGHYPDTYKLPGHPTFSIESQYYKPGMKAGYWVNDKYVPINSFSDLPFDKQLQLLGVDKLLPQ
jgi:hypothetical protein